MPRPQHMNRMMRKWFLGNVLEQAKQGSSGSMGVDVLVSPDEEEGIVLISLITKMGMWLRATMSLEKRISRSQHGLPQVRWVMASFCPEIDKGSSNHSFESNLFWIIESVSWCTGLCGIMVLLALPKMATVGELSVTRRHP